MDRRTWVLATMGFVMLASACDDDPTAPLRRFDRPTGTIIGLDRTIRGPEQLTGRQAMLAIAEHANAGSIDPSSPLRRAVVEWKSVERFTATEADWTSGPSVQEWDGDFYVWNNGESYAPAHKQAKVYKLGTDVTRNGDTPADVLVGFTFDGHSASNTANWVLRRGTETIRSRSDQDFGSPVEPTLIEMTTFAARRWAAKSTEHDVTCDVTIEGSTRARAWYLGGWDVSGVSIGVNPGGPGGNLNFVKGKRGEVEAAKNIRSDASCPTRGDTTQGYGGDGQCTVCQQWFLPMTEKYTLEWWECELAPPSACEDVII